MLFFKNHAEFISGIEANTSLAWPSIQPSIETAQIRFIKPIIGTTLYESLLTEVQDTEVDSLTNEKKQVVVRIQKALRRFALYIYIPIADVQLSDKGVQRADSDKFKSAYKYQYENLSKAQLDMGFELLEDLIDYLDAHASDYSTWTNTDEYKSFKDLFIKTGAEFQRNYSAIRYPRRMFLLLRTAMLTTQATIIRDAITPTIYDALLAKNKLATPNFTDQEQNLLLKLKPAIAHFTVARGLPSILTIMDENGLHVLGTNSDSASSLSNRTSASDSIIATSIKSAENVAIQWLDQAIDYIKSVASNSVFPSWYTAHLNEVQAPEFNETASGSFSM